MKNLLLFIILSLAMRLPAIAQIRCEEMITWFTYFEDGKAQPRTKSSEYFKCTDEHGNIVKEQEFGDGRILQYVENTYNAKNELIKTYYTHGYESNDGGEGTTTYEYLKNDKTIVNTITNNYSSRTEINIVKNTKGLMTKKIEKQRRKSELLEDYNSYSETSTIYQYSEQDSLLKKVSTIKDSIFFRQITELYQYKNKLKVRFEYQEKENEKEIKHTVTTYEYDAQNQLIQEKTFELPQYLTKSVTVTSYQQGKIREMEKIDYEDFAKKIMSYKETKKFEYDTRGELSKTLFANRYFYEGSFTSFTETTTEQEGDTKKISTASYSDKSEDKRITIQLYKGEKLLSTEEYANGKLVYISDYEYNIK